MSPLSRYLNRQALAYYVLALPAIVLEVIFTAGITSNPQSPLAALPGGLSQALALLPWIIPLFSLYAVLRFRPSILVTLLAISFFVSAITGSQASYLGVQGGFGLSVALVIVATFSALIGFNYSRGAKLRAGRELNLESKGPVGFQVVGLSFELIVPLLITLALVGLVSGAVAVVKTQTGALPAPLSTLSSLYLSTRFGLVLISIFIAGALIWTVRQLLEPVIMYFTITHADAISLALSEVRDITTGVRKESGARPSGGWLRVGLALAVGVGVVTFVILWAGQQKVLGDLLSILRFQAPNATAPESGTSSAIDYYARQLDNYAIQAQKLLNTLFRMLWG